MKAHTVVCSLLVLSLSLWTVAEAKCRKWLSETCQTSSLNSFTFLNLVQLTSAADTEHVVPMTNAGASVSQERNGKTPSCLRDLTVPDEPVLWGDHGISSRQRG